ncbi:unnamed protein product [Dimorphilus gyrociliatus]|uniref:Uncharacterized protein n=1 Tax=Dimorphilus gyrociliatus TaxID=2664684 RepID=A0A7I8WA89_9ANNE|nr:unnamed protein product [Dimorphilus gyrociliatus]
MSEARNMCRVKVYYQNGDFNRTIYTSKPNDKLSSITVCKSGCLNLMVGDLTNNRIMKTNDLDEGKEWSEFINVEKPILISDMKFYNGYLIVGTDSCIQLYDIRGKLIWTNKTFTASKVACLFNGTIVFIDSKDGIIKLLNGKDGEILKCFPSLKGNDSITCFSNNQFLTTYAEKNQVVIYDKDGNHCGTLQIWLPETIEYKNAKYPIMAAHIGTKLYITCYCKKDGAMAEKGGLFLFESLQ